MSLFYAFGYENKLVSQQIRGKYRIYHYNGKRMA